MHSEIKIQSVICAFYNNTYCLVHHKPRCLILAIPNGGDRNKVNAMMSIAAGEYSGASDLLVIHFGKIIFVEVKTPEAYKKKNHGQSDKQIKFQEHVESIGFPYHIVTSLEEFKNIIEQLESKEPFNPFYS